jgi:hypothetical protein
MASDEQRKKIARAWDPKHWNVKTLRARYPRAFPQPGTGINDSRALTSVEADEVIALLEQKPEAPAGVSGGAVEDVRRGTVTTASAAVETPPALACDHDYAWSEAKAALVCGKCAAILDEPPAAEQPAQAALV